MAGGRFQDLANSFVEAMEAEALDETESGSGGARGVSKPPRDGETTSDGQTVSAPVEPSFKKAKRDHSKATRQPATGPKIRRIQMPPLDVFQRDYMETATPVILSGVSWFSSFKKCATFTDESVF